MVRPAARSSFRLVGWWLVAPAVTLLFAVAPAMADEAAKGGPPLPLKRVVLFSSSVGFFQHAGEVEGNQQIEFSFNSSDINDLLKSLVVQDQNGGLVTAVNYGSPEPITRTLRTFTIDLTDSPSLAEIFQQLRGQKVELDTPAPVSGTVVGVEVRKVLLGDKQFADVEVLNLRTDKGLVSVRIESIERTSFVDPKINAELQKALELLAADRVDDQKRVRFDFRGAGKRDVSVGYIQEAPVWKTSYRLVLSDEKGPFLQGWAIVENTTAQDWADVDLTLVSGRPISFVMELDQPLFMARPLVTPDLHASLQPRVYDQDLAARDAQRMAGGRKGGGQAGAMGGFGSGGFGMEGGMGGGMPAGGEPTAGDASGVDVFGDLTKRRKKYASVDLAAGVVASASGEDIGELFRYVIKTPVTLARNESAMLPIVNDEVQAEKLVIYNPAVHEKHPLAGLRLTNNTKLHLLQGPITLFDGDEYAGDARIEDVPPGATRLISYALDLDTEIAVDSKPAEQEVATLEIREGGLHVKQIATRKTHYTIKNASDAAKQVLIERPIDNDWTTLEPAVEEKTRSLHRFKTTAEAGKPTTLVITEQQDVAETFSLFTMDVENAKAYLAMKVATPKLKQALQDAMDRKSKVAALVARRMEGELRITALAAEQQRTRQNLAAVPVSSPDRPDSEANLKTIRELRQRYLTKLADLEDQIEKQRERQLEMEKEEATAKEGLQSFLAELIVE